MAEAIEIHEIGSDGFSALQTRLKQRSQSIDADLTESNAALLEKARATGSSEFVTFAEAFFDGLEPTASALVARTIQRVEETGDDALRLLAWLFDGEELPSARIQVNKLDLMKAADGVDEALLAHCKDHMIPRIRAFHERQKIEGFQIDEQGGSVGVRVRPLNRVGLYVPGGTAVYPSTLLMTAIPALAAGVNEVAVFTPSSAIENSPLLAALLLELGIEEVYRLGGAQAIAAAAIGTEKVAQVDKVVGPGNLFVALAKQQLSGRVGIDSFAGPSEVVILFDEAADPALVAADLLAQAEHDTQAAAIGVTHDADAAAAVQKEIDAQLADLPRADIARKSLEVFGAILCVPSKGFGVRIADALAPEHLEILTEEAETDANLFRNAGAIFIGPYSPEAYGDYCAGPNHVLPTAGRARWAHALSTDDFMKRTSIIHAGKEMLAASKDAIIGMARSEGLEGHARSVERRFQ